jgi:hypothetical protein
VIDFCVIGDGHRTAGVKIVGSFKMQDNGHTVQVVGVEGIT